MVAASTLIGSVIAPRWGNSPVDLLYLPAVLGAAILGGLRPALFAALISALSYNFFFTEPHRTFRIDSPVDIVTVLVLFAVALVTSQLAASVRRQAQLAAAHAARNATIAGLARRLLSCASDREVAEVACVELSRLFDCNAVLVANVPIASVPAGIRLAPSDLAAAALSVERSEPVGRGVSRAVPTEWQFHPVRPGDTAIAAMGLARDDGAPPVSAERSALLQNLLDQVALALERTRLEGEARDFATLRERDRLRSTLLSSIRRDLEPSVEAIGLAARQLRREAAGDKAAVATLASEAQKLDRYLSNLLELEP
jgi:two-component system sensor histidine kinase KdpD